MVRWNPRFAGIIALFGALALRPTLVRAELISLDLYAAGDGLLTRDTVSGLEWLDLPVTKELTYRQVIAGDRDILAMGFRHATTGEVDVLLAQFGLVVGGGDQPLAAGRSFLDFLGCTTECSSGTRGALGLAEAVPFDSLNKRGRQVFINEEANPPYTNVGGGLLGTDTPVSHFLVRTVPEPEMEALIWIVGLGVFSAGRRRVRRVGSSA